MMRVRLVIMAIGFFSFAQLAQADWTASQRITWTSGYSESPVIAVDPSGNLHVVWKDSTPGNDEIYYKKSTDGGASWSTSQRLTWSPGSSYGPA
jgi:hypothetical protein